MGVFRSTLIAVAAVILFNRCSGQSLGQHWQNYTYVETTYETKCVPYYYQDCSNRDNWIWTNCTRVEQNECTQVPTDKQKTGWRCQDGWTGSNCSIPVCQIACAAGSACVSPPDRCSCISPTSCNAVAQCSQSMDCYPGTCSGGSCVCPTGFSGQNCETYTIPPTISDCSAQLMFESSVGLPPIKSQCSAAGLTPLPVWTFNTAPSALLVQWSTSYYNPVAFPYASYAQISSLFGVTNVKFTIDFALNNGNRYQYTSSNCANYQPCTINVKWTDVQATPLMIHNQTITITVRAETGGSKNVSGRGIVPIQGPAAIAVMQFRLDNRAPTHCIYTQSTPDRCRFFPIYLETDVTTSNVLTPRASGWTDDGSGIKSTRFELFYMQTGTNGLLQELDVPDWTKEDGYLANNYRYSLSKPGVYALHLTVFDYAQNYARARKIFLYTASSGISINPDAAVYVVEASQTTGRQWINNLPKPTDSNVYRLHVVWDGLFQTGNSFSTSWFKAVDSSFCQWSDSVHPCIDDIYDNRYGLRSVSAIRNTTTGIIGYGVSFSVDSQGGAGVTVPPPFTFVRAPQQGTIVEIPASSLTDGDTVVVWVTATDLSGNSNQQRFTVSVDRTLPVVSSDTFSTQTTNEFTSSFVVNVVAQYSGIKSIQYSIFDIITKLTIHTDTVSASTLPMMDSNDNITKREAERTCPPKGDPTCYCIPSGTCYPIRQTVDIDNCVLDRHLENPLEIQYTVISQSGNSVPGKIRIITTAEKIKCRPRSTGGLDNGGIVGIVIGGVVILLIVVLVAMMCWRWRNGKHPVPERVRSAYHNSQKRIHRLSIPKTSNNPLYSDIDERGPVAGLSIPEGTASRVTFENRALNDRDNDYEAVTLGGRVQEFNADKVHYEKLISQGTFAYVSSGWLNTSSGAQPLKVVIKALARGHSASDVQVMREKIQFFAGLPPNENVVRFIGYCNNKVTDEDPLLLFEFCDMSLKTWLTEENGKPLSTQVLDDMYTFSLNIARGVEFLHSNSVIHRRIRCGNVVLQKQKNGMFVAKLIGFGPSADANLSASNTHVLPVRWLAPETLNSPTPLYNQQTDAWSYAVTVWEIYSKGAKPYETSCKNADNLRDRLVKGLRLEKPDDCPSEIFDEVLTKCWNEQPSTRPDFTTICRTLTENCPTARRRVDYYPARAQPKIKYDSSGLYAVVTP